MQLTVGQADRIIRVYYLIHQNNAQQLEYLSADRQVRGKKKSSVTNQNWTCRNLSLRNQIVLDRIHHQTNYVSRTDLVHHPSPSAFNGSFGLK